MNVSEIELPVYRNWSPTQFDTEGLACANEQDWFVHPCSQTRDSGPLYRSNFEVARRELSRIDPEADDYQVHRFGHWGPGWFEIILVRPGSAAHLEAQECAASLSDYPALDDDHHSELCDQEAQEIWERRYSTKDRLAYIERRRSDFDFDGWVDFLAQARGRYFRGDTIGLAEGC